MPRPAFWRSLNCALLIAPLAACGTGGAARGERVTTGRATALAAPSAASLGDDPVSRSVLRGRAILRDTRDSLPGHVGAALRCVSCHLDDGTRAFAMPWVGVYARFPQYRSRSGRVARLEDRINDCIRRSLNGTPLPFESDDMRDIVAYLSWLSSGTVAGRRDWGSGIDSIGPLVSDTLRGKLGYIAQCARCHGAMGEGIKAASPASSGTPLWGDGSFNIGSGMARVRVAAAFMRRNMPFDQPGTLTDQMAFDIAGYLATRPRPDFVGKENDWPNGDPPPDVAYRTTASAGGHRRD